tara:strand:+ start:9669 stop:9956 length:288 start_codon:yes stop_codon:yes gene_type:complete
MVIKIIKLYETVTVWLPVLTGLILAAEAELGDGAGADKKKAVLENLTDVLDDSYVWIKADWAQRAVSCVIDLIIWLLNKKPEWTKSLGKLKDLFA